MSTDNAIHSAITQQPPEKQARNESIIEIAWRRKGWVFGVTFLSVMLAAVVLAVVPKQMTVQSRIVINRSTPASGDGNLNTFLNTQAELIRSATVLSRALDGPRVESLEFFPAGDIDKISYLKEKISVEPMPQSSVLTVRLASSRTEDAGILVQAVTQSYVAYVDDQKKNVALEGYDRLAESRNKIDAERTEARKQLVVLASETRSLSPDDKGTSLALEKLKVLSAAFTAEQLQTVKLKSQYDDALKAVGMSIDKIDADKLASATAVSADSIALLQNNLAGLTQQLIEAKRQFVPTHPAVRTIQAQIKDLQLSQAATLGGAYESALKREADARELYVKQNELTKQLDAKAAELAMLQDRVKVLDQQVGVMDAKLTEINSTESVGFTASAVDNTPELLTGSESPSTWRTVGFAAIIGVCLGVMSALVREWVSPSLGSAHRIADTVGVPVLGTLPHVAGRSGRDLATITHDLSNSEAAEAFRSIRTSMLFGAGQCKTITVTSPSAKEGKTTLATNLAISLAQSGKRVALIDASFREPTLHTYFSLSNNVGLTSVLGGDEIESAMLRTQVEHLDVLPAGPASDGVSEQLNSNRFGDLLRDLNHRYDHVIFDAPSVAGTSDARVIAAGCDQTILVVRGEKTNRFATTTARDGLLSVGATLMGIVVNDAGKSTTTYPPVNGGPGERSPVLPPDRSAEIARRIRAVR